MKFDLDQKNNADDDIIDLTDIIEKGNAPTQSAAAPNATIDTALSDLGNSPTAPDLSAMGDVDLDALLAQMDSDGGFSHLENDMPQEEFRALGNPAPEAADAPDLSDVDALLAEMDMPPQPDVATPPAASASSQADDDIDAMLAGMLDSPAAQPVAAQPTPAAQPVAPAPQNAPLPAEDPDISDDLDALFESMLDDTPPAKSAAPTQPQAAPAEDVVDDMDALLKDVLGESTISAADVAASLVPKHEQGQELSFEDVAQAVVAPQTPPKATEPLAEPNFDSLGAELDAILNDDTTPQSPNFDDDLEALLNAEPAPKTPSLDDDLDAILGASEKEVTATPEPDFFAADDNDNVRAMAANIVAQAEQEEVQEFDTPVAQPSAAMPVDAPEATAMAAATAVAAQGVADSTAPAPSLYDDSRLQSLEERMHMLEENTALRFDDVEKQISLSAAGDENALQGIQESLATQEQKLTNLEAQSQQAQEAQEKNAAMHDSLSIHAQALEKCTEEVQALQEKMAAHQASLEALQQSAPTETQTQQGNQEEQLQQVQTSLATQEEKITQLEAQNMAISQEAQDSQTALHAALEEHTAKLAVFEQKLESATTNAEGSTNASEDISMSSEALKAMEEKVRLLETAATEAVERENTMKEIVATQVTKLENSVQAAVNAVKEQAPPSGASAEDITEAKHRADALQAKVDELEATKQQQENTIQQLQGTVSDLEQRLHALEEHLDVNLEKMAATAAAKVLREEIMALLSEG